MTKGSGKASRRREAERDLLVRASVEGYRGFLEGTGSRWRAERIYGAATVIAQELGITIPDESRMERIADIESRAEWYRLIRGTSRVRAARASSG